VRNEHAVLVRGGGAVDRFIVLKWFLDEYDVWIKPYYNMTKYKVYDILNKIKYISIKFTFEKHIQFLSIIFLES
jgi:hypothetical protein